MTVDGRVVRGVGEATVRLEVGDEQLEVKCLVMPSLVDSFRTILGMDVVARLGGVAVSAGGVRFGREAAAKVAAAVTMAEETPVVEISDKDFEARFDGQKWTVGWKWRGETPVLRNKVDRYRMSAAVERRFDEEVEKWKAEGWLRSSKAPVYGWIPFLAVEQTKKDKVRPVMDFRELNQYVESYTGDSDVCSETTRKWRMMGG